MMKNQREVRLQTLRALSTKFEKLDLKSSTPELVEKSDIIDLMVVFEESEIGFVHEKSKILQIERIKSHIENGNVPELYLDLCFNFLVGSFWIKFTPLFPQV